MKKFITLIVMLLVTIGCMTLTSCSKKETPFTFDLFLEMLQLQRNDAVAHIEACGLPPILEDIKEGELGFEDDGDDSYKIYNYLYGRNLALRSKDIGTTIEGTGENAKGIFYSYMEFNDGRAKYPESLIMAFSDEEEWQDFFNDFSKKGYEKTSDEPETYYNGEGGFFKVLRNNNLYLFEYQVEH